MILNQIVITKLNTAQCPLVIAPYTTMHTFLRKPLLPQAREEAFNAFILHK